MNEFKGIFKDELKSFIEYKKNNIAKHCFHQIESKIFMPQYNFLDIHYAGSFNIIDPDLYNVYLLEQIEKIVRGLNQLGMVVRGANGEGSESYGAFFQLSNQQTLGMSEPDIISKILKFGGKLAEFETNARLKLMQQSPLVLVDKIERSAALLKHCRLIDTAEAVSLLSNVRLAADMGFCKSAGALIKSVDAAIVDIQPSHLQHKFNIRESEPSERDAVRASYLNAFAETLPDFKVA